MHGIVKTLNFEDAQIKFEGADTGIFEGYASVFDVEDSDGDVIAPGAFAKALQSIRTMRPVGMFFNHRKLEIPVGRWIDLREDSRGLYAKGELTPGHSQANDIKAAMRHGTVGGMSVGMLVDKSGFDLRDTGGRIFKTVSVLREISLCTYPANEEARILSMKSMDSIESLRDCENWLRDAAGFSKSDALAFIASVKSASLRDSGGRDELSALAECIRKSPI